MKALCTMSLLFALAACSHLETRTPASVDLSGTWELDARRSDLPPPLGRRSRSEVDDGNGTCERRRPAAVQRTDAAVADAHGHVDDDRPGPDVDGR